MDTNNLNENNSVENSKMSAGDIFFTVLKYLEIICVTAIVSVGVTVLVMRNSYVPKEKYDDVVQQLEYSLSDNAETITDEVYNTVNNIENEIVKEANSDSELLNIISVEASTYSRISESEYSYYSPESGNIFVVFFVVLENTSDHTLTYSFNDFEVYQDDINTKFTRLGYMTPVDGYNPLLSYNYETVEVKPGRKQSGYLAIEVPEEWEKIEFIYKENDTHTFEKKYQSNQ